MGTADPEKFASSGRATLTQQAAQKRHILHLLYGAPQVRGKAVPTDTGFRVMEMIEDIPTLGPVTASVRLPRAPSRVYDALTGADVPFTNGGNRVEIRLPPDGEKLVRTLETRAELKGFDPGQGNPKSKRFFPTLG